MTDWSAYVAYRCQQCHEECINRRERDYAQARECRQCYFAGTIGEPTPHPAQPVSESEVEGAQLVTEGATATEVIGGERQSPSTARPAGSAPSWGDPEGRAPPPNPEGEGHPGGAGADEYEQTTLVE